MRKLIARGAGVLPFDMYRYDACCPARQRDAAEMERTYHERGAQWAVALECYGSFTPERWRSFGVAVRETDLLGYELDNAVELAKLTSIGAWALPGEPGWQDTVTADLKRMREMIDRAKQAEQDMGWHDDCPGCDDCR